MWSNGDEEVLKEKAYRLCQEFLEGPWQEISLKDFQFSVISGGLSNHLYHCSLPDNKMKSNLESQRVPDEVLLRIFGPIQEDVDVITRETTIFILLSEKNLGPKLYGIFPNGRLEQFIPSKTLSSSDLRTMSKTVAREMAKIHALQVPIPKKPTAVVMHMKNWLDFAEKNCLSDGRYSDIQEIISKENLRKEIEWIDLEMQKTESPAVFCHNDLQGGNILFRYDSLKNKHESLMFIDFEFSSYNFRGFDIGNHFCEWCFDYNTKEFPHFKGGMDKFPTKNEQIEFIEAYLDEMVKGGHFPEDSVLLEEEKQRILKEVLVFRLSAHLLWAFWCIKMELSSSILFPFWEYGKVRLNAYKQHKEELLNIDSSNTVTN